MKLRHFNGTEFGDWWPYMDQRLLESVDAFRDKLRSPVMISPAEGALGRHLGMRAASRHNVDRWTTVQAVDVMLPRGPDLRDEKAGRSLVHIAWECGFGGIGIYPEWKPYPGMHLDIRPLKPDGSPYTWTRIGALYVAMEKAWEKEEAMV